MFILTYLSPPSKLEKGAPSIKIHLIWLHTYSSVNAVFNYLTWTVASPRGEWGSGPPTSVQTPPEISTNPLKSFYIYGGYPMHVYWNFYCSPAKKYGSNPPPFLGWRHHCTWTLCFTNIKCWQKKIAPPSINTVLYDIKLHCNDGSSSSMTFAFRRSRFEDEIVARSCNPLYKYISIFMCRFTWLDHEARSLSHGWSKPSSLTSGL